MLQFEQVTVFLGFLAWCERREFLRAFDVRLRGTAIGNSIFCDVQPYLVLP